MRSIIMTNHITVFYSIIRLNSINQLFQRLNLIFCKFFTSTDYFDSNTVRIRDAVLSFSISTMPRIILRTVCIKLKDRSIFIDEIISACISVSATKINAIILRRGFCSCIVNYDILYFFTGSTVRTFCYVVLVLLLLFIHRRICHTNHSLYILSISLHVFFELRLKQHVVT